MVIVRVDTKLPDLETGTNLEETSHLDCPSHQGAPWSLNRPVPSQLGWQVTQYHGRVGAFRWARDRSSIRKLIPEGNVRHLVRRV